MRTPQIHSHAGRISFLNVTGADLSTKIDEVAAGTFKVTSVDLSSITTEDIKRVVSYLKEAVKKYKIGSQDRQRRNLFEAIRLLNKELEIRGAKGNFWEDLKEIVGTGLQGVNGQGTTEGSGGTSGNNYYPNTNPSGSNTGLVIGLSIAGGLLVTGVVIALIVRANKNKGK